MGRPCHRLTAGFRPPRRAEKSPARVPPLSRAGAGGVLGRHGVLKRGPPGPLHALSRPADPGRLITRAPHSDQDFTGKLRVTDTAPGGRTVVYDHKGDVGDWPATSLQWADLQPGHAYRVAAGEMRKKMA